MTSKRIYIAGPYSRGNVALNVSRAMRAADILLDAGHYPYCPHLWHFQDSFYPRTEGDWLKVDLIWLKRCQVVLRLPGRSAGADAETEYAHDFGIPVAWGWKDLELMGLIGRIPK